MQPDQTVLQSLGQLWRWLTEPATSSQEPERRRQAQLLLSLLLSLILAILVSRVMIGIPNFSNTWQDLANVMAVVAVIVLAGIYRLSRSGYYKASAIATVAILFVLVHAGPFFVERGELALFYAILPIFLTGMLLSLPVVFGVAAASLGIMLLFIMTAPAEKVDAYTAPIIYTALITGAIVTFIRHRNLIEKDRQAAPRENEKRFRSIFEGAAVSIWEEDFSQLKAAIEAVKAQGVTDFRRYLAEHPDFVSAALGMVKVTDMNNHSLEMFGATSKEELGGALSKLFLPETKPIFIEELVAIFEGSRYFEAESIIQTLQGEQRNILLTISFSDQEAAFDQVIVSILDITERKLAEEALRESTQRLQLAVRSANVGLWDWDLRTDQIYYSPEWKRQIGYTEEEISNDFNEWRSRIHPDDLDRVLKTIQAYIDDSRSEYNTEFRFRHKDGSYHWIMTQASLHYDEHDKPVRMLGSHIDITERKQMEEALRKSEVHYRALIESQIDLISRYLPDTTLTFVNDAYCKFYGKTREELIGHSYLSMVAPEFHERSLKNIESVVKMPTPITSESLNYRWDGKECWIQWVIQGIADENGRVVELQAIGRDITRLKQSEQILRQSEEDYRDLYENAPNGYLSVNREGLVGRCNRYLVEMLGYNSADEIVGMPVEELYADTRHGKSKVLQILQDIRAGGNVRDEELQMQKRDGTPVWVSLTANAESDDEGQFYWTRSMVVNITERKRAEEALRESEERYRIISELISDYAYAYRIEPDGRLVAGWGTRDSFTRLTGYTFEEIGVTANLFHPEEQERVGRDMQAVIAGKITSGEYRIITKSGELRWLHIHRRPVWDAQQNRVVRYFGVGQDITERKQAEETLQRVAEQRKRLLEVSRLLLAALSPDEVIKEMRQALQGILPYDFLALFSLDEATNLLWPTILIKQGQIFDQPTEWSVPVGQGIIGSIVQSGQGELINEAHLDPRAIYPPWLSTEREHLICFPVQRQARIIGVFLLNRLADPPFTIEEYELVQLFVSYLSLALENAQFYTTLEQRVIERTAQLEIVNKELEAFSYSVSHDLRAPLRAIDGFSQALLEDCSDQLDEPGQDYLRRVRGATQRMGQLIDDMLALSRITRSEMHRQPVNLSALVEMIAAELRQTQPQRSVEFVIAPGVQVEGDPHLLQAALENLISNAWKFTQKQTQATIEFGITERQNQLVYFIRDNGVGFDMAYADKLFGPFQRLHARHEFEGTGIGLATVQRIIQRHEGRIWAESAVGQGATFYFTL